MAKTLCCRTTIHCQCINIVQATWILPTNSSYCIFWNVDIAVVFGKKYKHFYVVLTFYNHFCSFFIPYTHCTVVTLKKIKNQYILPQKWHTFVLNIDCMIFIIQSQTISRLSSQTIAQTSQNMFYTYFWSTCARTGLTRMT